MIRERWKAVKGVWHGSSKNNGKSCCGVRDKWITISKIAVPLGIGAAMTADVLSVCVLTGILHLVLLKSPSVKNINQCIDAILKNH